jgi:Holliday junction resolvase
VRTETLSIEAKYTDKKSYSLKQDDLTKGERYALIDGRDFLFVVSFSGEEWAVARREDVEMWREAYDESRAT